MHVEKNDRGFQAVVHPQYVSGEGSRLLAQSSAINFDYDDSFDRPGSSFLWVGAKHHLDRDEVAQMVEHMKKWLETGRLE